MSAEVERAWIEAELPNSTPEQLKRLKRRRRATMLAVPMLVGLLGGVVVALLLSNGEYGSSTEASGWREAAAAAVFLLGVVIEAIALVHGFRRGKVRENRNSPLWAVGLRRRRAVMRQIRGRRSLTPDEVPFLRTVAQSAAGQRWYLGVLAGLTLIQLGQALLHGGALSWFSVVAAFALVLGGVSLLRLIAASERFLREHVVADQDN